jgi:hypothetical protein
MGRVIAARFKPNATGKLEADENRKEDFLTGLTRFTGLGERKAVGGKETQKSEET